MVLIASIFVTLLFDLPMQEIKYILMGRGKQKNIERSSLTKKCG